MDSIISFCDVALQSCQSYSHNWYRVYKWYPTCILQGVFNQNCPYSTTYTSTIIIMKYWSNNCIRKSFKSIHLMFCLSYFITSLSVQNKYIKFSAPIPIIQYSYILINIHPTKITHSITDLLSRNLFICKYNPFKCEIYSESVGHFCD